MRRASSILLIVLFLVFALASPERAQALGVEIEGRFWFPEFSGTGSLADLGLDPDLDVDLDVDELLKMEADNSFELRATVRLFLGFYLRGAYQSLSNSGLQTVSLDDLDFDFPVPIPPINIDADVRSSLDFDYGRLGLGWRFVAPTQIFSVGAFVEAKGFSGDATIGVVSPIYSDSATESFEAALGSWGLTADVKPGESWEIFGEASFTFGSDEADMTDWELGGRWFPTDIFGVGLGYRVIDIDGEIDNVIIKADWTGFFLTAVVEF